MDEAWFAPLSPAFSATAPIRLAQFLDSTAIASREYARK